MTHALRKTTSPRKTFAALALAALACAYGAAAQGSGQTQTPADEASLRRVLAAQPDYTAVEQFLFNEGFGGFGASSRVMKLGRRTRSEEDERVFISEPGRPTIRLDTKRKEYVEVPKAPGEGDLAFAPEDMAASEETTFKLLGEEKVGEYACRRIEVRHKDERLKEMRHVFCVAPGLRNLVVLEQRFVGPVTMTTVRSDVKLGPPPEELFRVPAGYKKVAMERDPGELLRERLDALKKKSDQPSPQPRPQPRPAPKPNP